MDDDLQQLLEIAGTSHSAPAHAVEDSAMKEIRTSLESCRPLNDPAGFWAKLLPWLLLMTVLITLISVVLQIQKVRPEESARVLGYSLGFLLFSIVSSWLMMRPMRITALKPKVLFLRAFSRDRQGKAENAVRNALRAALPPCYALAGIRPPVDRTSPLLRALGETVIAMKYIGSNSFELEAADRNWFARLLSSATQAHAIVIDMRSLTPFVHDEIELATRMAVSPGRLFLITDGSRSAEEWFEKLEIAAKSTDIDRANVTLIEVPIDFSKKQKKAFMKSAAASFAVIPDTPMQAQPEAWKKARSIVSDSDWPTPWSQTPAAYFLIVGIPLAIIQFLLGQFFPTVGLGMTVILIVPFYLLYTVSWVRLLRIARTQRSIGSRPLPGFFSTFFCGAPVILLFTIAGLAALALPNINRQRKRADAVMMVSNLRQIHMAMYNFDFDYSSFPSAETEQAVASETDTVARKGLSSNTVLGQLIRSQSFHSEAPFSDRGALGWSRAADEISDTPDTILAPGECVVSYVSGLGASADSSLPLLMYPMTGEGTRFDREILAGKAIIINLSGASQMYTIERDGTVREFEQMMEEVRAEFPEAHILHPERPTQGEQ